MNIRAVPSDTARIRFTMKEKLISDLRYAVKNVFYHKREFLSFFIAVFAIQVIFGVVTMCCFNNDSIDYAYASSEYDYHLELRNLNTDQYYYLRNNVEYSNRDDDAIYDIVKIIERNRNSFANTRYDLQIRLRGSAAKNLKQFHARYDEGLKKNGDGNYSIVHTPLVLYETGVSHNRTALLLSLSVITLIAFFLLLYLFTLRFNHFKLTYGIYLTFGAGFKKLFRSSFWEMLFITAVTFIPAGISATLLSWAVYARTGVPFHFQPMALVIVLGLSMLVTSAAVLMPIAVFSRTMPIAALASADNGGYVCVPRVSDSRMTKRFPRGYLFNNLIRFRRYLFKLAVCGVSFSVVFMGIVSFAGLYHAAQTYNAASFTLDFSAGKDSYEDAMTQSLTAIEGVQSVVKTAQTSAGSASSHILLDPSDVTLFSGFLRANVAGRRYAVTNAVSYRPLDAGMAEYLTAAYRHDGDIASAVGSSDKIVISADRYNHSVYRLKPGDTIQIATFIGAKAVPETIESGNKYLMQQLTCNRYAYRTYTVAAVIYDMPTGEQTPLYLPCVDYTVLTKNASEYQQADIYLAPGIDDDARHSVSDSLRAFAYRYDNAEVKDLSEGADTREQEKNYYDFLMILAYLVLIISPVIWMFAQILFYLKRDTEFFVLESFGATRQQIRRIYLGEGAVITVCAVLLYTLMSLAVSYVLFRVANRLYIYHGFSYSLSPVPFSIGLVVTGSAAFVSSLFPYLSYRKSKNDVIRSAASEERI